MSTATTYTSIPAAGSGQAGGRFKRIFDRMIEAQMRVARRRICDHLRVLDDRTLTAIGFTGKDVAILRAGGEVDFPA